MQKNADGFWTWVQDRMDEIGIVSYRELERRSGVSNGVISSRRNALKFPTVEMAEGLCQALRVSWIELWAKAGFVEELQAQEVNEQEALRIFRSLPKGRVDAALDMMRGLAGQSTLHARPTTRRLTVQDLPVQSLISREALERALDWWSEVLHSAPDVAQLVLAWLLYLAAEWYEHGKDAEQLIENILKDENIADGVKKKMIKAMQESRRDERRDGAMDTIDVP